MNETSKNERPELDMSDFSNRDKAIYAAGRLKEQIDWRKIVGELVSVLASNQATEDDVEEVMNKINAQTMDAADFTKTVIEQGRKDGVID